MSVPVTAARLTPELSSSLVVLALTTLVGSVTVFVSLALVCCVLFAVPLASASVLAVLTSRIVGLLLVTRLAPLNAFSPLYRFALVSPLWSAFSIVSTQSDTHFL